MPIQQYLLLKVASCKVKSANKNKSWIELVELPVNWREHWVYKPLLWFIICKWQNLLNIVTQLEEFNKTFTTIAYKGVCDNSLFFPDFTPTIILASRSVFFFSFFFVFHSNILKTISWLDTIYS